MGETVKASKAFQSAAELATSDKYFGVWWIIGWMIRNNRLNEAEQLLKKQNWDNLHVLNVWIMVERGQKEKALKLIPKLDDASHRAYLYARLNMKADAIRELNKINEKRNIYLSLINDGQWKKFHGDPEFEKILAKQKALHEDYTKRYAKYAEEFIR